MAAAILGIPTLTKINEVEAVNKRILSSGKIILSNGIVVSRYLKPPQGSCHDICKYGGRNHFGTDSKSTRIPISKLIMERREGRKKSEVKKFDVPVIINIGRRLDEGNPAKVLKDGKTSETSLEPSYPHDLVDMKIVSAECEAPDEENAETKFSEGENETCLEPSDSEGQTPGVDHPDCGGTEDDSWTTVSSEFVSLPNFKESVAAVEHARSSKPKPLSKSSSDLLKKNTRGSKSKEINVSSATGTSVSNLNAKKKKSGRVSHLKKQEIARDAKESKNMIESNPENKPAEAIQTRVHVNHTSKTPSSSSESNRIKHAQNRIPIGRSPRSYEKKNIILRQKGIRIHGLSLLPSSSSVRGKNSLRSTPNGLKLTQPSLTSSSSLASSSKSSYDLASSQHNEVAAEKQTSASKMMSTGRAKRALITPSKGKVIQALPEDCTPKRLVFKRRVLTNNRNEDNQKGKVNEFSTRRLKFKQRVIADNQKGNVEDRTPRRVKFKQRVIADNRNDDNQKGNVEGCAPKRLKFKQRAFVDNGKDGNSKGNVEDGMPRRLKFKPRLFVDNGKDDNQKGNVQDRFTRKLSFKKRVLVDNRNENTQSGRTEEFTPRRLKFRQRVHVGNRNAADSLHGRGEDHHVPRRLKFKPRMINENETGNASENVEADPVQDITASEVQSQKDSLRRNDVTEKKESVSLCNEVIEKAASRLETTKSSKVKALVSAFESVISQFDSVSAKSDTE